MRIFVHLVYEYLVEEDFVHRSLLSCKYGGLK